MLRKGKKADKERVNRIMRENDLLSPYRHDLATIRKRTHDGVIDHFNDQLLSWHICKKGDRYAAVEPVRDAIRKVFGNVEKDVCKGLELKRRSDHGTQYDSNDFNRTLEEEVFSLNHFRTLDEAQAAIKAFIDNYNKDWLIGRLGYKSPLEYMSEYEQNKVALATA